MDNAMVQWDAAEFAEDLDFLQNYYSCCGSITYSDWENVPTFTDYATVSETSRITTKRKLSITMQPLKSLYQMAASRNMIHSTLLQLNVSSNFRFRRVQSTSMIICKFFILDDGLFYTSTDQVYTKGCALSMGEFIYDNVIYILAPIILSVSVTEFVLLLKSLFCTQPIRTDYLLK